jgi:ribose 5-phosphate isomerase A
MDDSERLHRLAKSVASEVPNGSLLGLGSGSTAEAVVRALGRRIEQGARFTGVATSKRTADLASTCGIQLVDLNQVESLDMGIDGADEISPELYLVKGRGGALLHEKLVALSCSRLVIVAACEKLVEKLGTRLPLPIEVVQFAHDKTSERLLNLGLQPVLRISADGLPFVTDSGNFIYDCATGAIESPEELDRSIKLTTGVVDHGLFLNMASEVVTVDQDGKIQRLKLVNRPQ